MATWKKILLDIDSSVSTANITDLAVTTAKIKDNQITNIKMADNAIDTIELVDLAVTDGKIANTTITGAKIADSTIGLGKLTDQASQTLVGNGEATAGPLASITLASNLKMEDNILDLASNVSLTQDLAVGRHLSVVGNLTVNGSMTALDTLNLTVKDKNIMLAKTPDTPANYNSSLTASGSGITIDTGANGGGDLGEGGKDEALMPTLIWKVPLGASFMVVERGTQSGTDGETDGGIGWKMRDNAIQVSTPNQPDTVRPVWSVVGCQFHGTLTPTVINKGMLAIVGGAVYIGV